MKYLLAAAIAIFSFVATANDKPVVAIDDAINAPAKNIPPDKTGEYSTESASVENKVIVQKKPVHIVKKPVEYRKKNNRKKRRIYTKYKKQTATENISVPAI